MMSSIPDEVAAPAGSSPASAPGGGHIAAVRPLYYHAQFPGGCKLTVVRARILLAKKPTTSLRPTQRGKKTIASHGKEHN